MLKPTMFIIFMFLGVSIMIAQERFMNSWISNPIDYKSSLEQQFSYMEVPVYQTPEKGFFKQLENGYASSEIKNPSQWKAGLINIRVTSIDIVFTKYPQLKSDWITNYHKLLADRLSALFLLDPSLNDLSIQYRMVLQTDCKTEKDTKAFFHGIVIHFELKEPEKKTTKSQIQKNDFNAKSNPASLYDTEFEYVRKPRQNIKDKKKTKRDLPKQDCPDFSTKRRKVQ